MKISLINQLKSLSWLFFFLLIIISVISYFVIKNGTNGIFIFLFLSLFQIIPTIYIHVKYYFTDKNKSIVINYNKIEVNLYKTVTIYNDFDIQKIIIYKSANMDSFGIPLMVFENYYYAKIILKNGTNFELTCLIDPEIEQRLKKLENVKFERVKGFSFMNI